MFSYKKMLCACAALAMLGTVFPARAATPVTDDNLREMLQTILRENPELVLDVLRDNSETVLDIAQQGSNLRRTNALREQWKNDLKKPKTVATDDRPLLGSAKAPVRIVAFSDFTCHFCQQASRTLEKLMDEYGNKVCLVFKSLPQDADGPSALAVTYFVALAQQDQAKAWKFHNALFANRDKVISEGEEFLRRTAKDLGADMRRLDRDRNSRKVKDIIKGDLEDAEKLAVEGTPYFLVNNLVVRGALPQDLFKSAIEMALSAGK